MAEASTAPLDEFIKIVGEPNAIRDPADMVPFLTEWRDRYHGRAALVLRPGSTEEVSAILRLANETRTPVVPQGGNTGLVGAQIPYEGGNEIVISLSRMNRIREVDAAGFTMTVEAGVILQEAQNAADAENRFFPLSLAAEGSCQVGGNISTNAGGTAVLAYGNTRELVLGLEVVMADGRVLEWSQGTPKRQYGLRPQRPVYRGGRHARHCHGRGAQALSQAGGTVDRDDRPV